MPDVPPKKSLPITLSPLLCLTLLPAAGCSFTQAPTFKVVDVQIRERTQDAHVLAFTVEGDNPNKDALPLRTVRYSLAIEGQPAFSAQRSAQATLPPMGRQRFVVPAVVEGPYAYNAVPYSFSGSVEYLEPGTFTELLFDNDLRRSSGNFSERGRLTDQGAESSSPPSTEQ